MSDKEKREIFETVCFRAQDKLPKHFVFDISDLICKKNDTSQVYRIVYINRKVCCAIKTNELDTYHFDEEFFSNLYKLKTNQDQTKSLQTILDDLIIIDIQDLEENYYLYIQLSQIIHLLINEKKFGEKTFFSLYHFIQHERFKYPFLKDIEQIGNAFILYAVYILYYMEEKGFQFDSDKNVFIDKEEAAEGQENNMLL